MPVVRTDPIRNFKFEVQFYPLDQGNAGAPNTINLGQFVPGIGAIGFAAMSGLSVRNEMIPYREGGMNTHPHKMVGQSDFEAVTFSRGVFENQDQLWKWQRFIHNWQSGVPGSTGGSDYRCDVVVKVYDHPHSNAVYNDSVAPSTKTTVLGTPKLGIKLFNCWPGAYAVGPLNAGDNNIMIQEIVLHNEGWILAWTPEDISALPGAR